jgi:redox-sensing transcriptional repressor
VTGAGAIPAATVGRLVAYLRVLRALERSGTRSVSSEDLAAGARVTAFQVRKDLAYFGRFGTRGAGYATDHLLGELRRILGLQREWRFAIVGMGRLGQALADYPHLDAREFALVAAFDVDPAIIGRPCAGVTVQALDHLADAARDLRIDVVALAVPAAAAQSAVDRIVAAGIRGILNFVPAVVVAPPDVRVEPVDFSGGLLRLAFHLRPAEHRFVPDEAVR